MSSAYTNYGLLTEEQHTDLLNLYATPGTEMIFTYDELYDKSRGLIIPIPVAA